MLTNYLPRSQAALKRHRKRIESYLQALRGTPELAGRTDLELVLLALGDQATKDALMRYWRYGGEHPITAMDEEDVRALDHSVAQAIVLSATCDPAARVRQKSSPPTPRR